MKRTCKQCGIDFEIKESEINYYKSKNLEIPKRCPKCRQENKSKNLNSVNRNNYNMNKSANGSSAKYKYLIFGIICLIFFVGFLVSEFVLNDDSKTDNYDLGSTEISNNINTQDNNLEDIVIDDNKDEEENSVDETDDITEDNLQFTENSSEEISEYVDITTEDVAEIEINKTENTSEYFDSITEEITTENNIIEVAEYRFRNKTLLENHFKKHGIDMGFVSATEYEKAASAVVTNPEALHKIEQEDGDDVYYVESTNEFVVVSKDGYIRTYFLPDKGIDYYNKQ